MKIRILTLALVLSAVLAARADVIVSYPEVNYTSGTSFPSSFHTVATDTYGPITAGSATLSGVFGSTSQYYGSSAEFDLYINGFLVGSTFWVSPDPYNNVVPFSFVLSGAALNSLNSGSATLGVVQESDITIRLSSTTLDIQTVPESGSMLAILGVSICGLVAVRRKFRAA